MHRVDVLTRQLLGGLGSLTDYDANDRKPLIQSRSEYDKLWQLSVSDPAGFWASQASLFHWNKQWKEHHHIQSNFDLSHGPVSIEFFKGGQTNISFNCLDRWVLSGYGSQPCYIWEGNEPHQQRTMTYKEVLDEVCRVANWLKAQGVRCGDTVTLYLPMTPELPITMLACARIGAMHSVVFAGFSADSLAQRIVDAKSQCVVTASGMARGQAKVIALKEIFDSAAALCTREGHAVRKVLVLEDDAVPRSAVSMLAGRDVWWHEQVPSHSPACEPEWVDSEAPLFLLYTSGSTGKPKGVVHATGGYMVAAAAMLRYVFDVRPGDVFFATADCGWITGHTTVTYGPLLLGASSIVFGAVPVYPSPARCWEMVEKYRVRAFYTAPTLIRLLLQQGDKWVQQHDLSSLRILGTAGEPIGAHAWQWFHDVVGRGRCPVVDTWWQTETGSVMLTPFPGSWCHRHSKPGSARLPFFGVRPALMGPDGQEVEGAGEGLLVIKGAVPSMARTLFGNHDRYETTYFSDYKGCYFTGDGCRRDEDGDYWITGRVDDVINISGHRIGTAELEGVLTDHEQVSEAAVIGVAHPVKGQAIYAYVTLRDGSLAGPAMRKDLLSHVRSCIGAFAVPEVIHWAPALPKTRSGKLMRRILKKIALGDHGDLGDVSTLADPSVVDILVQLKGQA